LVKFGLVFKPVLSADAQALPCPVGPGGHWPDPDWGGFCMSWIGMGLGCVLKQEILGKIGLAWVGYSNATWA
jgi:hypothetical protein